MSSILVLFSKMETMNKRVYLLFICLSVLLVKNIFAQKMLTNFPMDSLRRRSEVVWPTGS